MFGNTMSHVEKAIRKKNAPALIKLCTDKDPEVCIAAIAGLGVVGGDEGSNYLISRLQSVEPSIRIAVARALGELGDMHTKAHVAAQLDKEKDPEVHKALSNALAKIRNY